MKTRIVALATLLSAITCQSSIAADGSVGSSLASSVAGCSVGSSLASSTIAGSRKSIAEQTPPSKTSATITFVRPLKNEAFNDQPIYSQVLVSNFNLVAPALEPGQADGKSGHIDYTLDDFPVCSTKAVQMMFGKNLGHRYIPVGRHVLRVELKDTNNNSLNPKVMAEVALWTRHPAATRESNRTAVGAASGDVAEELQGMRNNLEQVHHDLLKIQNGGFQPTAANAAANGVE